MSAEIPGLRAMRVGMSGQHLGRPGTPASLREHLGAMRANDVVQAAAKILIWMEEPGRDALGAAQRELAEGLFPEHITIELLRALDAGGDAGGFDALFYPGQLLTLQKLALRVSQVGPPTSFDDGALVWRFVLAAAQVGEVRDQLVNAEAEVADELGGAMYAIRASELNHFHLPQTVAGRAYRLWLDARLPWPDRLESPEDYCRRRFGVGVREFVAIAAAPPVGRLSIDLAEPGDVPFSPEAYFAECSVQSATAAEVLEALTYRAERDFDAVEQAEMYWSFLDLADRPLMPCGDGLVVPCSLRYSLERATTGLFWMMHAAGAGNVGPFTTHFGRLFEDYCLRCAEGLRSPSTVVSGEVEYGTAASGRRSADILVSTAQDRGTTARVFIECRAGRPSSAVFTHGSREAFSLYIVDLIKKLVQLDRSITDHLRGSYAIPGDIGGADDSYLPMLVVDVPFHWTFLLKSILDRELCCLQLFRDPRVALPIVCSIEEFEATVAACERGANLADLLGGYLATDRMDPLHQYVYDRTGPLRPPAFTQSGWDAWQADVRSVLFGGPATLRPT